MEPTGTGSGSAAHEQPVEGEKPEQLVDPHVGVASSRPMKAPAGLKRVQFERHRADPSLGHAALECPKIAQSRPEPSLPSSMSPFRPGQ
jgi:hypothetical protein